MKHTEVCVRLCVCLCAWWGRLCVFMRAHSSGDPGKVEEAAITPSGG